MSHHIDLKQSLEHIDALPAMSVIAKEMLTLALNTEEGEARLLKRIIQNLQGMGIGKTNHLFREY
ncbi:MAG: hypothetical protein LM517_11550 [Nitrosomonas sp.]|nr:hypothetical protein [Nitrosomonas sp.]